MYVFTQIKIITLTKVQKHFYEERWLARIILCLDVFLCQLNFDTYTKSSHFQPKIQSFLCKAVLMHTCISTYRLRMYSPVKAKCLNC